MILIGIDYKCVFKKSTFQHLKVFEENLLRKHILRLREPSDYASVVVTS